MEIDAAFDWIVLLPSKLVPGIGVPNRYYGKRSNGELKVRGIELRRHNTPPWLYDAQERVLGVLARAGNAREFYRLIPAALRQAKQCAAELPGTRPEDLAITVTATKDPDDYAQETHTRIALRKLRDSGIPVQPGQRIAYVVLRDSRAPSQQRAIPLQLLHQPGPLGNHPVAPSSSHYLRLLARSLETLLAPAGYREDELLAVLEGRPTRQLPLTGLRR
jgi:DNA polymerase-2